MILSINFKQYNNLKFSLLMTTFDYLYKLKWPKNYYYSLIFEPTCEALEIAISYISH